MCYVTFVFQQGCESARSTPFFDINVSHKFVQQRVLGRGEITLMLLLWKMSWWIKLWRPAGIWCKFDKDDAAFWL